MDKKITLGLNLIVGPGEQKELERLLESCKGDLFDEIVVTLAMKKEDPVVRQVAERYTDKIYYFEWIDDFAAARNYSFSKSTTTNILWLDADDKLKPKNYEAIRKLKPELHKYDIVIMDYAYTHDDKDNPMLVLPRERIVKNCPEIKWHDPIHEYMNISGTPPERQLRTKIVVDHYRTKPYDTARNLDKLKEIYESEKCSPRISFYYGKELSDCGRWDEAIPVLEKYIEEGADFRDNMTVACIRLSRYYIKRNDYDSAKNYAFKGVRFNSIYAENYVMLGMVFEHEKQPEIAERYYKEALTKKLEGGMSQQVDFYGYIPCAKLALLHFSKKNYEEALGYCDKALGYKPENAQMMELRKAIDTEIKRLKKGITLNEGSKQEIESFLKDKGFLMSVEKNNLDFADLRIRKSKSLNVVWLIPGLDLSNPSTRIRRYSIHQEMLRRGIKSRVIEKYHGKNVYDIRNEIDDATVVIFTQFSEHELKLMKHLKLANIKIVFDHCEALFGYKHEDECMREAHLITCCSTKLEEMTNERGYTHTAVIKDPSELKTPKNPLVYDDRYEKPKAVYLGMGGNSFLVTEYLKDTIESAGYDLVVISEWDDATVKWDEETWADEMTKCDVALCPQRVDIQPAKSNVKLTAAMPLGLPVLASPIQSYKEIIEHGENGFICETKDQWHEALVKLKDPKTREKIGKAGQEAIKAYALPEITSVWVDTLTKLSNDELSFPEPSKDVAPQKDRELVDIIIASYGNVDYLKMCINSILMNTGYPFHIIISDAGSGDDTWKYLKTLKGITVLGEKDKRLTYSEACNAGIRASNTKYFVILNSDVVVSRNWLTNMIDKMDSVDRLAACGVLSNCDRGWLHDNSRVPDSPRYKMRLEKAGIELVPGMKMEKIKPHVEELYDFMAQSNEEKKGKFLQQQWVAVYATVFARCAINEVGLFDPLYKNGCEDLDLCRRLTSYGYNIGQAIDSFVFHFGGVTRASYESENKASYRKEDVENHMKYKAKWEKQRIAIYTGPAWEPWNKEKVDQGMAGSETWASYLAREFVKKGYRCIIYNDLLVDDKTKPVFDQVKDQDGKIYGDVIYRDYRMLQEDIKYDIIDYFISSRTLEPLKSNVHSVRNYVMIHDIWLSPDKNYDIMSWRIQKYGYLSEWHKNFLRMHHGMPEEKMFLTANGVDTSLYADVDSYEKKNQTIYSSSPDRGLYQLLQMLPLIRREVKDFKVVITYGFYNWESACKARGDTQGMQFIERIKNLMDQEGVEYFGRIPKADLAKKQMKSKVWLYPTWFTETHCCHPNNEIFTKYGPKKIIKLCLEDEVLTHENRFRRIEKIMSRYYSGDLIKFRVQNHTGGTGLYTTEHPILTLKGENTKKLRMNKNLIRNGRDRLLSEKTVKKIDDEPQWVPASEIEVGDYVCVPFYGEEIPDSYYFPLEDARALNRNYKIIDNVIKGKNRKDFKGIPDKIPMDVEWARFLGLYMAEGCYCVGSLKFSFGKKEKEYVNFVRGYLKKRFNYESELKDRGSYVEVLCYCNLLGCLLKALFGPEASQKRVPYFIYKQNKKIIWAFLKGVFEGDGSENKNEFTIELSSKTGIAGIKILLGKLGLHPSYRKSVHNGEERYYQLGISKSLWNTIFQKEKKHIPKSTYRVFFERDGKIFYKIKDVERVPYKGLVYNLEVEEDQSYTSDFIAVHNCIGSIEAGNAKSAIVTTDLAGLTTTVKDSGTLLSAQGLSREGEYPASYTNRFVEEAIRLLTDEPYRKEWADKAYRNAQKYTWDKIADRWIEIFEE